MISIIVAASTNMVIGKKNKLLWHLPNDLKNFKFLTEGKKVIMGRKTWESLPDKFRPLPNRENFVVTKNQNYRANGAILINDLDILKQSLDTTNIRKETLIMGGSEIYKEFFPLAKKLYLTEVLSDIEGDTYLEGFNSKDWLNTYESDIHEENGFRYKFKHFVKKDLI